MNWTKKWYKAGDALLAEIDNSSTHQGEALLWFLGQTGFVIKIDRVIIYIDAILHDYGCGTAESRLSPPPFSAGTAVNANCFICTHDHSDHLNMETLLPQALGRPETVFIVPAPSAGVLASGGIERRRIIEARQGEPIMLTPQLTIHPIAAAHSAYQTDDAGNHFFLGYIISGGGITIYHAGDGIVTEQLIRTLEKYRPIDIAILPVNGMDWERTAQGIIGNMNSEDAAKLARTLDVDLTIPSHFDFLRGNTINPAHFTDVFYALCPEKKFHIPALGERIIYRKV